MGQIYKTSVSAHRLLHFLVSAMLCAGLDAERVADIYRQKHAVNLARQKAGYSQSTKTEEDNRSIHRHQPE